MLLNLKDFVIKTSSKKLWQGLYFLSFPAAILLFFLPQGYWGAIDEGQFLYEERAGYMSWWEHLGAIFLPQTHKVFLFGTYRPLPYGLYFKLLSSLGMGIDGFRYSCWIGSWFSCLIFSWGLYTLIKKVFTLKKDSIWLFAFMIWWTPTWLLCTHLIYPDCWMQPALIGLFWGFYFGDDLDLPVLFRNIWVRYFLGSLAIFLAFQSHETTLFLLFWTYFWILANRLNDLNKNWQLCFPLILGLAYLLFYRSLDSDLSNRPEIIVSYHPADLAITAIYYFFIGLNGISQSIFDALGLKEGVVGVAASEFPFAFGFTLLGLSVVVLSSFIEANSNPFSKIKKYIFLILGGVFCTVPYLVMKNRSLVYYGIKLQIFLSACVVVSSLAARDIAKIRHYWIGLALFWVGGVFGTFTVMGENWAKTYGSISKGLYAQIMKTEGVEQCTSDSPCCLKFLKIEWLYNEYTVNWNDGAPLKPRFIRDQGSCKYTLRIGPSGVTVE